MREVSCRPVRSDDDTFTGAPRCSRMLTFRSRSIPDTCRGDVFAGDERPKQVTSATYIFVEMDIMIEFMNTYLITSDSTGMARVYKLFVKLSAFTPEYFSHLAVCSFLQITF